MRPACPREHNARNRLQKLAVPGILVSMPTLNVKVPIPSLPPKESVGAFIREQRTNAQVSLRQLAQAAGVSNPYLSQIERGLRKPSGEILQGIARGLQISAETLYVQAGLLDKADGSEHVLAAIRSDVGLTAAQKTVLVEIYQSFRRDNTRVAPVATTETPAEPTATSSAEPSAEPTQPPAAP
jgi:transcriptional regulator with XRE-family HTH domain